MAVVWLDILTPKQFWFFKHLAETLLEKGLKIKVTSRRYEQITPLLKEFTYGHIHVVGEFGGEGLRDKLEKSLKRSLELLQIIDGFDVAVSSGSPEAARIAYGLGKPHILTSDTPESPVNKLVAPLSKTVLTPWIIGKKPWIQNCVKPGIIKSYRALDPVIWLKNYRPIRDKMEYLGLDDYILVRSPEYKASYLLKYGWNLETYIRFLRKLSSKVSPAKIVVLPRYDDEVDFLKKKINSNGIVVVEQPVTGWDILYHARVFLGGGGTMTQEAALLGIPTISIYPGRLPRVVHYLKNKGLVKHIGDMEKILETTVKFYRNFDKVQLNLKEKALKMVKSMEDPRNKIVAAIVRAVS